MVVRVVGNYRGKLGEGVRRRLGGVGERRCYVLVRRYLEERCGVPFVYARRLSGLLFGMGVGGGEEERGWVDRLRLVRGDELVGLVVREYDKVVSGVKRGVVMVDREAKRWEELLRKVPRGLRAGGREVAEFLYNYAGCDPGEIEVSEVPCRGALVHLRVISGDRGAYLEFLRSPLIRLLFDEGGGSGRGRAGVGGVDEWVGAYGEMMDYGVERKEADT